MKKNDTIKELDPSSAGAPQAFVRAAKEFEVLKADVRKASEKRAWLIAYIMSGLAILGLLGAFFAIFFRVEPQPTIIEVDHSTGISRVLRGVSDVDDSYNDVIQRHFLGQYVSYREGYDWNTISTTFDAVNLMSSNNVASIYSQLVKGKDSPLNIFQDKNRVLVKITSITFIGDIAQVRFTRQTVAANGLDLESAPKVPWIATVAYDFDHSKLMTPQERLINPLGFIVQSYNTEPETMQK